MKVSLDLLSASITRYQQWQSEEKASAELESAVEKKTAFAAKNLEERNRMIRHYGSEPADFAYERAIGKNDSVYSNFPDLLNAAKRKVGRIMVKEGSRTRYSATGFMVSERLLLTNWHVFEDKTEVLDSEVQFNYELDATGRPKTPIIFKLAAEAFFFSNKELDYCLVAVQPMDILGKTPLSSIGYHFLNPNLGKLANEKQEFLNIVHHPDGDYMQLSIRENRFVKIQDNTIWYEADTAPGSSGGPVFNDQFQVVALHHMGVPSQNENGDYLDKDGKVIEDVLDENGKVDISKLHWVANEGIRISKLLEHLNKSVQLDEWLRGLQQEPVAEPVFAASTQEVMRGEGLSINVSAGMLQTHNPLVINLQSGGSGALSGGIASDGGLEEAAKVKLEEEMDYSQCTGYDPMFLGKKLPMPLPGKNLKPFAAKRKDNGDVVLPYFYFSTIQHSIRKVPMISAINVDGDPAKRLDKTEREDVWLRDRRIDYEAQLNDKYYSNSNFDKGHMSRREDANWGDTAEDAKRFADLTCMYTNACQQVPALNRSNRSGLWGKLEKLILENGVTEETGNSAKISVFNGPVFATDDPVYKGVQVPMHFWKIVVWQAGKKKWKATAFKLTQTGLTGDVNFEATDFDKNVEFKEYQCSIKSLAALTGLDFSALEPLDTYPKNNKKTDTPIGGEKALLEIVKG